MIDKKISVSEQVSNLSSLAKVIFTWSIPHADDLGLLPFSSKTLKAMIIPMNEMSISVFNVKLEEIIKQGLWKKFEYGENKYYRIVKFFNHQTLKKDRKPNTLLENITSWDQVEKLGFHLEDNGNPREEKIREDKLNEDKINTSSSLKKAKAFYRPTGEEMRFSKNKWWVIPDCGGSWLEFAGDEKKDIVWR
ncbi:MAG: hypothetical protein PHX86_08205 [Caldisericia bacterium]|nr:hypothetical protein [Caldisericia bacterium]